MSKVVKLYRLSLLFFGAIISLIIFTAVLTSCSNPDTNPDNSPNNNNNVITLPEIGGVTVPVTGAVTVTTITETAQYAGAVSWYVGVKPIVNEGVFDNYTVYTAKITLTAKEGFTFTGVADNFFTVAGATSTKLYYSESRYGLINAVFPATGGTEGMPPAFTSYITFETWLAAQKNNTADTAYTIALNVNDFTGIRSAIDTAKKYVFLDFSGSAITAIPNDAFYIRVSSGYGVLLTGIIIPNGVTSIGDYAFCKCEYLKNVTISNTVSSIGIYAFGWCDRLAAVDIPESVTSIGNNAFINCTGLTEVTINGGWIRIGDNAFSYCRNLTFITFQKTIRNDYFAANAFMGSLKREFYKTDSTNGTPGTYFTSPPVDSNSFWTKSP